MLLSAVKICNYWTLLIKIILPGKVYWNMFVCEWYDLWYMGYGGLEIVSEGGKDLYYGYFELKAQQPIPGL